MLNLLTDRCTIRRSVTNESDTGEVTETFADQATEVPCSIQPRSGFYRLLEAGERGGSTYVGYFMPDVDIEPDDEVEWAENVFRVVFVAPVRGHHLEVDLTTDRA